MFLFSLPAYSGIGFQHSLCMGRLVEAFVSGILENQKTKETSNLEMLSHKAAADSVSVQVVSVVVF